MDIRHTLYPLGFLTAALFSAAALRQSKRRAFWQLTFAGSLILTLHTFIQMQYAVCVVQSISAVVAWRYLDLMKGKHLHFREVFVILGSVVTSITALFVMQNILSFESGLRIARAPTFISMQPLILSKWTHLIGVSGLVLSASYNWFQWWLTEEEHESPLSKVFWWISLLGSIIAIPYFAIQNDPVNTLVIAVGLTPYARALFGLRRKLRKV